MSQDKREVKKGYNPAGIDGLRNPDQKAKEGYNPTGIIDGRGGPPKPPSKVKKD